MTDDPEAYGLGAIQSPPDERDWDIGLLYAAAGEDPVAAPPATYTAPAPYPPVYNQGVTPMCVAYSNGSSKVYQDLRDTGLFPPDQSLFFSRIGGTQNGAVPRIALAQMLDHGYPPAGNAAGSGLHRIAAYYAVPVSQAAVQSAIMSFGPVLVSLPWYRSWFHPGAQGVLPTPDAQVGGHEILAVGWDARGLHLRNSWGAAWGVGGDCWLPWAYLARVWEVWKSADAVVPKPRTYTLRIAANANVVHYALSSAGCLTDTKARKWGPRASSAPCGAARVVRGCTRGQATVVPVPKGAFAGRWVRLGAGVTVTWQ
jgi:hypothetical protein